MKKGKGEVSLLFWGVFLSGMAGITLEISFTRIFSLSLWHHFAFLSIAIALFGFGVSGVFLTVYPNFIKGPLGKRLSLFSFFASISVILAFASLVVLKPDVRDLADVVNVVKFGVFYLFLATPFFWIGSIMAIVMEEKSEIAYRIYFYDLVGSGLGCVFFVFLISLLSGQGMVILASGLLFGASLVFAKGEDKVVNHFPLKVFFGRGRKIFLSGYFVFLALIFVYAHRLFPIPLPKDKALYYFTKKMGAKVIYTQWTPFSRVDGFFPVPPRTWGLSSRFRGKIPPQIGITIDGDGFTSIVGMENRKIEDVKFPFYTLNSMVYTLCRGKDALIIGSGGGIDVLSALCFGVSPIDAVEINPAITYMVEKKFAKFSGHLFQRGDVHLYTADGRNFVKRSDKKYTLIYLPLVDSWAATYSGAYALSENFLYTVEAFRDYYDHVKEGGFISISRWEYKMPHEPYQTYRICAMATDVTKLDLRNSVAVVSHGNLVNLVWKKGNLTKDEIEKIKAFCKRGDFKILYLPGMKNKFSLLLDPSTYMEFVNSYPLDISPVTDDKPYFYLTDRWRYFWVYLSNYIRDGHTFPVVFTIILTIVFLSFIFSIIFMLLPLYIYKRRSLRIPKSYAYVLYFSLIGLAFMFVEITLMNKFSLYLGHPAYSLSVVLFSILFFSGLGSWIGSRVKRSNMVLFWAIFSMVLIGVVYYLCMDKILLLTLKWGILKRVLVTFLLIMPLALCMGVPFPTALKTLGEKYNYFIPWAWGVNGVSSVLGSVLSLVISQTFGFWKTLLVALILYLFAFVFFRVIRE